MPDLKLYYKAIVIKTVWYWHKKTHREENREPRNKPTLTWSVVYITKEATYTPG